MYRPTPIAETGFLVNPDTTGRIGMNNLGEIVYGIGNNAFLWLPEPNYDLAAGLHNLNSISDRSGDCIARGINDHGFVIGTFGGTQTVEGEAIVWNLNDRDGNDKIVTTLLDSDDEFVWSGAFGISNHATNPLIVGAGGILGDCTCADPQEGGGPPELRRRAFSIRLNDAPLDSADILETNAQNSFAWDVTEDDETIAGQFHCVGDNCPVPDPANCDEVPEAIAWVEGDAMALDDFATSLSNCRGTNALAELVGSSYETDFATCLERAIYWTDSTSDKVVLGSRMPTGFSNDKSRALAINNPPIGPTQVVGFSPNIGFLPLLFQREGCTEPCTDEEEWQGYNLEDLTLGTGQNRLWRIRHAHNVNDDGSIVVSALKNGSFNDSYVVLLTPMTSCLGDIVGSPDGPPDGVINVFDLLALLASWNSCGDGDYCLADIAGPLGLPNEIDGQVDVFDLLYLLNKWGDCADPLGFVPEDEQDCFDEYYPDEMESLEACLEAVAKMQQQF